MPYPSLSAGGKEWLTAWAIDTTAFDVVRIPDNFSDKVARVTDNFLHKSHT